MHSAADHPREIDSVDDEFLVARLRAGQHDALDALFRRHCRDMVRVAAGITGSADEGQDVVQDVFVALETTLRGYDERGTFARWLKAVTVRTALTARRKSARRRETSTDAIATLRDRSDLADAVILATAVDAIPAMLREVFVLKMVAGYSHAEIGAMLGIRSGTSEVRLFRALRHLRSLLTEHS